MVVYNDTFDTLNTDIYYIRADVGTVTIELVNNNNKLAITGGQYTSTNYTFARLRGDYNINSLTIDFIASSGFTNAGAIIGLGRSNTGNIIWVAVQVAAGFLRILESADDSYPFVGGVNTTILAESPITLNTDTEYNLQISYNQTTNTLTVTIGTTTITANVIFSDMYLELLSPPNGKTYYDNLNLDYTGTLGSFSNITTITDYSLLLEPLVQFSIVSVSPQTVIVQPNTQIQVSITVANNGISQGTAVIEIIDQNNNIVASTSTIIDPGAQVVVSMSFNAPSTPGTYNYTVLVLDDGQNQHDNALLQVTVSSNPQFQIVSVDPQSITASPGELVSINVTITNNGGISGTAIVQVLDQNNNVITSATSVVDPGAQVVVPLSFNAQSTIGIYNYTVVVLDEGQNQHDQANITIIIQESQNQQTTTRNTIIYAIAGIILLFALRRKK